MGSQYWSDLTRRDFIKYTLLTAGAATLPAMGACSTLGKNVPVLDYSKQLILTHCHVIDVVSGNITKNASITILDGKITRITTGKIQTPPDAIVIDLENKYVTPGLIDAHCHSTVSPVFSMSMRDLFKHAKQQKDNYILSVESGVTTIRDMGAFPGLLKHFIGGIENDSFVGPRVVYCNSILNIKGSHPEIPPSDINIFAVPASWFVGMVMNNFETTKEMNKCLNENANGASFIKLTMDDRSVFCKTNDKTTVYSDEQLDHIVRFSEEKKLPISVHHHYKFGFDRALKYPINSLEHIVSDCILSDEDILKMKDNNVSIVPTLTLGQSFMMEEAFDEVPEEYRTEFLENERKIRTDYFNNEATKHCIPYLHKSNLDMLKYYKKVPWGDLWKKKKFLVNPDLYYGMMINGSQNLKKMHKAGVLIGCGIDAGMPLCYFGSLYREFEFFSRLGFSNLEILQCATINNARILHIDEITGAVEKGKSADLVAYDTNPLDTIKALRSPSQVFREGKMMYSDKDLEAVGKMTT